MSFWQFSCAVAGYVEANSPDDGSAPVSYPSDLEFEQAILSIH